MCHCPCDMLLVSGWVPGGEWGGGGGGGLAPASMMLSAYSLHAGTERCKIGRRNTSTMLWRLLLCDTLTLIAMCYGSHKRSGERRGAAGGMSDHVCCQRMRHTLHCEVFCFALIKLNTSEHLCSQVLSHT